MSNLKEQQSPEREAEELDQATLLYLKEFREDWELLQAITIFRKYEVWNESEYEPDWHKIRAEAIYIGRHIGD